MRLPARLGLQAQLALALGLTLVLVLAVMGVLMQRQRAMQAEVDLLGRRAVEAVAAQGLSRRGAAMVQQLADALANPMYYSDLDAIGTLVGEASRQPDVAYVLVFDAAGNVVNDGSRDMASYGRSMRDPLAARALASRERLTQWTENIIEVSQGVELGQARLGGVRIGYSLAQAKASQEQAAELLHARLDALARRHLGWIAVLLGGLLCVFLGMAWYVQRALVRPIRALARSARAIGMGHYEVPRPTSRRRDELGELVRAFSEMGQSIARHDREVRQMAYTDALTGLSNRLAFRQTLDRRLLADGGGPLALLFADIDDFKRVNDSLGHEAGDEVLLHFASRIGEAVRRLGGEDAVLARFGGDEFVILIQDGQVRVAATRLAQEMVQLLGQPLTVQGRQVFLGISVGITLFPEDADSASALMKNGDVAMYQAKMAGKNCFRFYSRAMDQAAERRVRLEAALRGAWERGEMSLVYQPIYRLSDNRIVGAEALLRWQHPQMGTIAPAVFVEVAEQSGLIEQIGVRVLHTACAAAARWPHGGHGSQALFVSVNVSPRQLRRGDLPELVTQALHETGLSAARLHLELTETAVIGDQAHASTMLAKLHRAGVKVWLDDFGTGFSGLSHLRRVPVDGVKIDRSFVADLQRNPDDLALTTAIIAMAHSLGISVVAEGVEKQGQLDLLRERGCDLAQGFWLGYPLSEDQFTQLL